MTNQYAVYRNDELRFNCIIHIHDRDVKVGEIINGAKVVHVGSLYECEAMVKNSTLEF